MWYLIGEVVVHVEKLWFMGEEVHGGSLRGWGGCGKMWWFIAGEYGDSH
jgi:hypothetical protein